MRVSLDLLLSSTEKGWSKLPCKVVSLHKAKGVLVLHRAGARKAHRLGQPWRMRTMHSIESSRHIRACSRGSDGAHRIACVGALAWAQNHGCIHTCICWRRQGLSKASPCRWRSRRRAHAPCRREQVRVWAASKVTPCACCVTGAPRNACLDSVRSQMSHCPSTMIYTIHHGQTWWIVDVGQSVR